MGALSEKVANLPAATGGLPVQGRPGARCCTSARRSSLAPRVRSLPERGPRAHPRTARADGRGRRPRRHPDRHRGRGAAARGHADPAAPAALQRAAQGRQELPLRAAQRAGGVPAPVGDAPRARATARATSGRTPTSSPAAHAARAAPHLPGAHLPQLRGLSPRRPAVPLLSHPPLRRALHDRARRRRRRVYRALVDGLLLFLTGRDDELLRAPARRHGAPPRPRGATRTPRGVRDQIAAARAARGCRSAWSGRAAATPTCWASRGTGDRAAVARCSCATGAWSGKETRLLEARATSSTTARCSRLVPDQHYLRAADVCRGGWWWPVEPEDEATLAEALARAGPGHRGRAAGAAARPRRGSCSTRRPSATRRSRSRTLAARAAGRRARYSPERARAAAGAGAAGAAVPHGVLRHLEPRAPRARWPRWWRARTGGAQAGSTGACACAGRAPTTSP